MDAGIADTINRRAAHQIARRLDALDATLWSHKPAPWHWAPISETLMSTDDADRAWIVGTFAASTARTALNFDWDGQPADGDWENLFSHFRAEILARRNPQNPPAQAAETHLGSVV